jgi:hypothetical protein
LIRGHLSSSAAGAAAALLVADAAAIGLQRPGYGGGIQKSDDND